MRGLFCLLVAALFATSTQAADLALSLRTPKGRPVSDAVVTVFPNAGTGSGPIRFDWPYRLAQQDMRFDPFVLIVPVGATVAFPNRDRVRHQVYSFSPAHPFELKLYGTEDTRLVRFDRAGVIAVGCNIHDSMVAFIKVVDTPYAARTDSAGQVTLHLPAGPATLRIWHPYLKAAGNEVARSIVVAREGLQSETAALDLRTPPARRSDY